MRLRVNSTPEVSFPMFHTQDLAARRPAAVGLASGISVEHFHFRTSSVCEYALLFPPQNPTRVAKVLRKMTTGHGINEKDKTVLWVTNKWPL